MSCIRIHEDDLSDMLGKRTTPLLSREALAWVHVEHLHQNKYGTSGGLAVFLA